MSRAQRVTFAPRLVQRSPLIGRGFEAFSDDPVLSGNLAAQYIEGLQDCGVASCIKHFAAHDQSYRGKEDSVVMSERTLREIHLLPFQLAFARTANKPWAVMPSYNRINGTHCSEDHKLLNGILRGEWNFDGLIVSDWWGTYSTSEAINAGLDLEMPGPPVFRARALDEAIGSRKVMTKTIDFSIRNILNLINRCKAWDSTKAPVGTGTDTPESRSLVRQVAADSIVLLKNDRGLLPLNKSKKQRYGLIGEHFSYPSVCGGGSSESTPFYISTPLDAFTDLIGVDNFTYVPGHYCKKAHILSIYTNPPTSHPYAHDCHSDQTIASLEMDATDQEGTHAAWRLLRSWSLARLVC